MSRDLWPVIAAHINQKTGIPFQITQTRGVGGGSINSCYVVGDGEQRFFVKLNAAAQLEMFMAEAEGLVALAASQTIRVPQPLLWGSHGAHAYLVMEYLSFTGSDSETGAQRLGEDLAALHRTTGSHFGWHRPNTIGSTPQINTWEDDWVTFYREHRLRYQLRLAQRFGGEWQQEAAFLLDNLEFFFQSYTPRPTLVHGDLWGGNVGLLSNGTPVIFDPATYYGDRETDLAMTQLFGGFSPTFYRAYATAYPLDTGYARREPLYQLYHLLNHLNLFGSGYLSQVMTCVETCCRSIRLGG
ncbi:MAG: fructosamine kinase family protein [Synechococcales cyanobacterium]